METIMAHQGGNPGGTAVPEEHNKEVICLFYQHSCGYISLEGKLLTIQNIMSFGVCTEMATFTQNLPMFQSTSPDMSFHLPISAQK